MNLGDVLRRSTEQLAANGCESPRVDAERLVGHALGLNRSELYTQLDRVPADVELERVRALVGRRAAREPLQHIVGEWGFRRLTLAVDARALVPRPETEIVVERCLALLAGCDRPEVLDVGAGSGAIALAIADEHPGARVTAIDISPDALELARENAGRTGLELELLVHDLRDGLPGGAWDLVVSNPPYVDPADRELLAPEVAEWDPDAALYGVGLHETIARAAIGVIRSGGCVVFEVGEGQAEQVAASLDELGYREIVVTPDLTGRLRVVEGRR